MRSLFARSEILNKNIPIRSDCQAAEYISIDLPSLQRAKKNNWSLDLVAR